jgi:hypothetical protein
LQEEHIGCVQQRRRRQTNVIAENVQVDKRVPTADVDLPTVDDTQTANLPTAAPPCLRVDTDAPTVDNYVPTYALGWTSTCTRWTTTSASLPNAGAPHALPVDIHASKVPTGCLNKPPSVHACRRAVPQSDNLAGHLSKP